MKKSADHWEEAIPYTQDMIDPAAKPAAYLTITKIIREHVPLVSSTNGSSIGNMVDAYIAAAIENGDECQSIEINLEPSQWQELTVNHQPKKRY